MNKLLKKIGRTLFHYDPAYYDMFANPGERFFAELYLTHIRTHLNDRFEDAVLAICDAGCQAGRLAIPLAVDGHRVTGIDTSGFALHKAEEHARKAKVTVKWVKNDILQAFAFMPEQSFDAIVCSEVLYLRENYKEFLTRFKAMLKPQGVLFASHRTKHYYIAKALATGDFALAQAVARSSEGNVQGSYYNWQGLAELRELYAGLGFKLRATHPIGIVSGLGAEGLGRWVDPSKLLDDAWRALKEIELKLSDDAPGAGRYTLVVAEL